MPANFPDVWLSRVIQILTTLNVAPWLDGIPELDVEVTELGAGSASETNIIHLPVETFQPEVLINNTTYPIAVQEFTDDEVIIKLDKYQTKATSLTDDQVIGASYDRIDSATRGHMTQINSTKYKKAIHAQAPASDSTKTPVVLLSDNSDDVYKAIVALKDRFDDAEVPEEGRRLVLATKHYNALLDKESRFANLLANINTGNVAPMIAGFEIYSYVGNPSYTAAGVKKAFGAIKEPTDKTASVAFHKGNVAKKTGLTKQYFRKAADSPTEQSNLLNYRHYFIALPVKNEMIGAII